MIFDKQIYCLIPEPPYSFCACYGEDLSSSREHDFLGNCDNTDEVVIIDQARLHTVNKSHSCKRVAFKCSHTELGDGVLERWFSSRCSGNTPEECLQEWKKVGENDTLIICMKYHCIPGETRCRIAGLKCYSL